MRSLGAAKIGVSNEYTREVSDMYELIRAGERTYYIDCPVKIGLFLLDKSHACLIDGGSGKDAAKKALKILDAQGWQLSCVINTHSHGDHIGEISCSKSARVAKFLQREWSALLP